LLRFARNDGVGLLLPLASRIGFDCTRKGKFLGLAVNGGRVSFFENVFYEFRRGKILRVWSVIDKPAIEAQL
jgi:predicted ester cyclase